MLTWGTSPEMVLGIDGRVPDPDKERDAVKRGAIERALAYMGLQPNKAITDIRIDKVFIGSCTNSSYTDLMKVAKILQGKVIHPAVSLCIAPGSRQVLQMLAKNGALADIVAAGARVLESACGPCVGVGQAPPSGGVSLRTSNRNFEGRQGFGGRTHLVSPAMAAAAAVAGHFVDVRDWKFNDLGGSYRERDGGDIENPPCSNNSSAASTLSPSSL